ncbi:RICIN domain-containing protein [Streptomyces sp. 8N706]|uniref:RICIN domain-containing protein n=1 Tax=Streptomyces sp. 8N706 TaxID=3457416 RepID=UPI003FD1D533
MENQRWYLNDRGTSEGYPVVTIENANASGKCLDESRDRPPANGTAVYIYGCAETSNQKWRLVDRSDGYFWIENLYDRRCLDVANYSWTNGATIQVWSRLNGWNQGWE